MLQEQCRFSVIVPVLNESKRINALIDHIHDCAAGYKCQIIVIDGDLTGSTILAIRDDNVTALTSKPGRGAQMNAGAALAEGEILIFLHADTRLPPQAFAKIDHLMTTDNYVGGAFDLGVDSTRPAMRYVEFASFVRSRLFRIPYGDQAIFMRKDYFEKIGCYKEIPLMEDVDLMQRVKKAGSKISILRERVTTSARKWEKDGVVFGTLRNHVLIGLFYLKINPQKLARFYYGH